MKGVTPERPTRFKDRSECGGHIYYGVCLGEPKQLVPGHAYVRRDDDHDENCPKLVEGLNRLAPEADTHRNGTTGSTRRGRPKRSRKAPAK